jgi:hypothetical protein
MRVAAVLVGFAATFFPGASQSMAETLEITRSCFPGFCVESRDAFVVVRRDPQKGRYWLKVSRSQSVVYMQTGPDIAFPHCAPHCETATAGTEQHAFQYRTHRLVGRLVAPPGSCGGREAAPVYLYVYNPEADLARFTVTRNCQ